MRGGKIIRFAGANNLFAPAKRDQKNKKPADFHLRVCEKI
jgi:hypothetical protein